MLTHPGREVDEPQRETDRLAVDLGDVAEDGGLLGEQVLGEQLLGRLHLVQRALELRQLADHGEDQGYVGAGGRPYDGAVGGDAHDRHHRG